MCDHLVITLQLDRDLVRKTAEKIKLLGLIP